MRIAVIATLLAMATSTACAALWDVRTKDTFMAEGAGRHPWKKGSALPASLSDAGLLPDARLVWSDMYLDGGTRGYLFMDSFGQYLAFCTGPGFQSHDHPDRIDAPVGSRIFLGALHYTHGEAQLVERGSECEAFLKSLIEKSDG